MRRPLTTLVAGVLLTLLSAAPAAGHAGLMPGQLAPGTTLASELLLVHGCGPGGSLPTGEDLGSPTTRIRVGVPEGVELTPLPAEGWSASTTAGAVTYTATAADGVEGVVRLPVELTVPSGQPDGELWLPMVQDCSDGEQLAWTHEGVEAEGGLPAARVLVDRYTGMTAAERQASEQLPTVVVLALLVAVALLAGGGVYAWSARR
jgi:hypothetical protein